MIVAVTGGRDHWPSLAELECLADEMAERGVTALREGEARGVDQTVRGYVESRGLAVVERWPADWATHGRRAGMIRNVAMLDGERGLLFEPVDVLFAFRGGRGTAGCVRQATRRGITVVPITPVAEPRIWNMHWPWGDPRRPEQAPPDPLIYVGRSPKHGGPSPLANPWPVELREGETRAAASDRILGQYRRWLWARIRSGDAAVLGALEAITPESFLGCTCWPAHCHAEIIVRAWRWMKAR